MTKSAIDLRLGMKYKEFEVDFLGFLLNQKEGNFGRGDETRFLQRSDWRKVGNCLMP